MNRRDDPTDEGERHLVRNVALTLSGGAILSVVGVALAQGAGAAEAGSGSDGDASAAAGGAAAVGNQSDTGSSQSRRTRTPRSANRSSVSLKRAWPTEPSPFVKATTWGWTRRTHS